MRNDFKSVCIRNNSNSNIIIKTGHSKSLKVINPLLKKKNNSKTNCCVNEIIRLKLAQTFGDSFCITPSNKKSLSLSNHKECFVENNIKKINSKINFDSKKNIFVNNFFKEESISKKYDSENIIYSLGSSKSFKGMSFKNALTAVGNAHSVVAHSNNRVMKMANAKVVIKNKNFTHLESNIVKSYSEDYKPPQFESASSGQGFKNARIVIQKDVFTELTFNFSDNKIIGAIGLPQGMCLQNGRIKGTPINASKYNVQLKLDNNKIVNVLIIVPNLKRMM